MLEFLNNLWGARNRVGIGWSVPARKATPPRGIGFLESILGPLESLKIRAQLLCGVLYTTSCLPMNIHHAARMREGPANLH